MDYSSRTGNLSSRLAKREQKKAVRQTVMYLITAVFLIVAFVFIVVPGFLRFVASLSGSTITDSGDTFPPQVPVIAAPFEATSSASIDINGYGEADSQVVLVLNGNELEKKTIGSDGTFTASVPLSDGENSLTAYSVDANNNESSTGKTYVIIYDNEAPKLEISEPQPNQQIELRKNQTLTIKGTTEANARVRVNGRLVFANSEGAFTTTYQLSEGENKLTIEAEDKASNKTLQEITVTFKL
jgi:uncharacterized protein YfaP (DUF2135 family)